MKLTIYTANCCGKKNNTIYPNKCIIENVPYALQRITPVMHSKHLCKVITNLSV